MGVCLSGCTLCVCKHLQRPEEEVEAPETGVIHIVSHLMWGLGTEIQDSGKTSGILKG